MRPEVDLRTLAIDLFDRCLTERDASAVIAFVQRQIIQSPPDLDLFRDFADDLQLRLISLRVKQWDTRSEILKYLQSVWNVDIAPLLPAEEVAHLHMVEPLRILGYLRGKVPDTALTTILGLLQKTMVHAERLYADLHMTTTLQDMVLDWLDALATMAGREYWFEHVKPVMH